MRLLREIDRRNQDALKRLIKELDRMDKGAPPAHRIIMLGTGVMGDWAAGRRQLRKMRESIEKEVPKRLGNGWIVDIHWIGYPRMNLPFDAIATVSSVELNASGIQEAVNYFPDAIFDFVCYSMSGLIALYWAVRFANPEDYRRVNSITTINSPLKSYGEFAEACKRHIEECRTLLGHPYVPLAAIELQDGSSITGLVAQWNLPIHLVTIYTLGDEIVPPEIATLDGKSDCFQFDGTRWKDPLNRHRKALFAREVQEKVIDTICTDHLSEL